MLQIDEHVFRNMLAETAVAAEWRKVSLVPYVKQQLVLIAVDEAHCIPEWLVQYIIDVQLFRSTLYTFMCLYTYRGVEFSKAFKHVGELRALVDVRSIHGSYCLSSLLNSVRYHSRTRFFLSDVHFSNLVSARLQFYGRVQPLILTCQTLETAFNIQRTLSWRC